MRPACGVSVGIVLGFGGVRPGSGKARPAGGQSIDTVQIAIPQQANVMSVFHDRDHFQFVFNHQLVGLVQTVLGRQGLWFGHELSNRRLGAVFAQGLGQAFVRQQPDEFTGL